MVFQSTGVESETRLPFAGLHALLRPFLTALDSLPPGQRVALEMALGLIPRDAAPDLFLIGLAALGLVSEAATEAPLLLIVEDAHWIDRSSATVLAFLARRLDLEPVLVWFSVRAGTMSDVDDAGLPELDLGGLNDVAAAHLLDERGADLASDLKGRIRAEAAGNPLALIELPVVARSLGVQAEPTWSDFLPLTARLERAFAGRLDELDLDARALLLVAALEEGYSSELFEAAELLRGEPVDPAAWNTIAAAGLGTVDAQGFHFRHPLIRSAIRQSIGVEERRSAHSALATVFAGDPDRAIWHRAAAATGADETVASALADAAERARLRGAGDVAVTALERSASLSPDRGVRALRLWQAAGLGWQLGRRESERLFRDAQRLGLPAFEDAVASFYLESFAGTLAAGVGTVRAFTRLADDLLAAGDGERALQALATASVRAYWGNLDDETQSFASAVAKKVDVPRDDPLRLHFLAYVDPIRNGAEVIRQLGQLPPARFGDSDSLLHLGEAAAAVWADDFAVRFLRGAAGGFRAEGRLGTLGTSLAFEAWSHLHQGAVPPAMTSAAESARLAAEARLTLFIPAAKLAEAVAAAQRGQDDTARALIEEAEAILLSLEATPLLALVALARGRVELAAGRFTEGYERVRRLFDPADVVFHPFVGGAALADLVDAANGAGGDLELVGRHLATWRRIAAETQAPHLRVQLSYAAAVLATDEEAEPLFEDAITSGPAGWPFYSARGRLAYGAWLRRQRRSSEARAPLREALETFIGLGQESYAARAESELRASGETRRRMPEAWSELTPQELQIAQLAAEGLSNKEIGGRLYLSHRTIGTHLYHVFPKLGITSRAQLRDVLTTADEPSQR
jgi:DNA-binding NarL/FixJ family response regulator